MAKDVAMAAGSTPHTPSRKGKEKTVQPNQLVTPPPTTKKPLRSPVPEETVTPGSSEDASATRISASPGSNGLLQFKLEQHPSAGDPLTEESAHESIYRPIPSANALPTELAPLPPANKHNLEPHQAQHLQRLIQREHGEEVCGTDVSNDIGHLLTYDMV